MSLHSWELLPSRCSFTFPGASEKAIVWPCLCQYCKKFDTTCSLIMKTVMSLKMDCWTIQVFELLISSVIEEALPVLPGSVSDFYLPLWSSYTLLGSLSTSRGFTFATLVFMFMHSYFFLSLRRNFYCWCCVTFTCKNLPSQNIRYTWTVLFFLPVPLQ